MDVVYGVVAECCWRRFRRRNRMNARRAKTRATATMGSAITTAPGPCLDLEADASELTAINIRVAPDRHKHTHQEKPGRYLTMMGFLAAPLVRLA